MATSVSQECNTLLLNTKCHCLLCLEHEDPVVLQQIANENPRKLDFQSVLYYLTGDPLELGRGNDGRTKEGQFYPVFDSLPPLCKLCYNILAQLYNFHCELVELQRKMRTQTVAARRIVKATTRKRGGMRPEFFDRLKIGGLPEGDMKAMKSFVGNFQDLILEANQKSTFPPLTPMTLNDTIGAASSSLSYQSPTSTIQPYHVAFVDPMASRASITIPVQTSQPRAIGGILNGEIDLVSPPSSPLNNHIIMVDDQSNNSVAYEFEGTEEEEMVRLYEKLDEKEDDDVVILENETGGQPEPVDVSNVLDEEEYESDRSNELEEGGFDLNYLQSRLPSTIIMEEVDEEENEEQMVEEGNQEQRVEGNEGQRVEGNEEQRVEGNEEQRVGENEVQIVEENITEVIDVKDDDNDMEGKDPRGSSSSAQLLPQQRIYLIVRKQMTPPTTTTTTTATSSMENFAGAGGRPTPKPYLCGYKTCEKRFKTYQQRAQHERIHSCERPEVCDVCGRAYRQRSALYRHKKTHRM